MTEVSPTATWASGQQLLDCSTILRLWLSKPQPIAVTAGGRSSAPHRLLLLLLLCEQQPSDVGRGAREKRLLIRLDVMGQRWSVFFRRPTAHLISLLWRCITL